MKLSWDLFGFGNGHFHRFDRQQESPRVGFVMCVFRTGK